MTDLPRQVMDRIEQLPTADQDAIAEVMQRELDAHEAGRRHAGLAALDRLAELTADLPLIDAVQLTLESREDLDASLIVVLA